MNRFIHLSLVLVLPVLFSTTVVASPGRDTRVDLVTALDWTSPLGLRVVKFRPHVQGIPVHGRHVAELRDAANRVVFRAGSVDTLRLRQAAGTLAFTGPHGHEKAAAKPLHPLKFERRTPVWHEENGTLRPAYLEHVVDLLASEPIARERLLDAQSGAVLRDVSLILEAAPQGFFVYAEANGRPALSPFGHTWPHPAGTPDGWIPEAASQAMFSQGDALIALDDPWLDDAAALTGGNNVIAFFNSLINADGVVDEGDLSGSPWGPYPVDDDDFLAAANSGADFVYAYDPAAAGSEYFQQFGTSPPPPDPDDAALNAKIVQAFYAVNWLHDYFYRAGFDEVAGNAQASNFGRGGLENDPHLIHSGYYTTFSVTMPDGEPPVLALGMNIASASQRDASMDYSIIAHEWGHFLIGRTAGTPGSSMSNAQGRALHEGIADYIALLTAVKAEDDLSGAFAIGQYFNLDYAHPPWLPPAVGVPADAMYYGIRRYPYSTDMMKNPLTLNNLVTPPVVPFYDWKGRGPQLAEAHTAGEIFAQALFECLAGMRAAQAEEDFETVRLRKAQYLVASLMLFPANPTFLEARNALLAVMRAVDSEDHDACRAGFAKRGLGAGAIGPERDSDIFTAAENGFLDQDEKLRVLMASAAADGNCAECTNDIFRVELTLRVRNAGLLPAEGIAVTVTPAVAAATQFVDGNRRDVERLEPEEEQTVAVTALVDAAHLPAGSGNNRQRIFAFSLHAAGDGMPANSTDTANASVTLTLPAAPAKTSGGGAPGAWWLLLLAVGLRRGFSRGT